MKNPAKAGFQFRRGFGEVDYTRVGINIFHVRTTAATPISQGNKSGDAIETLIAINTMPTEKPLPAEVFK